MIDIDAAACKKVGISPSDILATMQGYYGGLYASNFNRFGKMYRVMVQADPALRTNLESLKNIKSAMETKWLQSRSSCLSRSVWTGYYQPFQYVYIY